MRAIHEGENLVLKSPKLFSQAFPDIWAVDFIQGRLSEQFPFNGQADVPNPALQPKDVQVGDDRHVGGELVRHRRLLDVDQKLFSDVTGVIVVS